MLIHGPHSHLSSIPYRELLGARPDHDLRHDAHRHGRAVAAGLIAHDRRALDRGRACDAVVVSAEGRGAVGVGG